MALIAVVGWIAWSRIDEHLTNQGEVMKRSQRGDEPRNQLHGQDRHRGMAGAQ